MIQACLSNNISALGVLQARNPIYSQQFVLRDKFYNTFSYCAQTDYHQVMSFLFKHNYIPVNREYDPSAKTTLFHLALRAQNLRFTQLLTNHPEIRVDIEDRNGHTVLDLIENVTYFIFENIFLFKNLKFPVWISISQHTIFAGPFSKI